VQWLEGGDFDSVEGAGAAPTQVGLASGHIPDNLRLVATTLPARRDAHGEPATGQLGQLGDETGHGRDTGQVTIVVRQHQHPGRAGPARLVAGPTAASGHQQSGNGQYCRGVSSASHGCQGAGAGVAASSGAARRRHQGVP